MQLNWILPVLMLSSTCRGWVGWGIIWHTAAVSTKVVVTGCWTCIPLFTSDLLRIPRFKLIQRLWSLFSWRLRTPGRVKALVQPWARHGYGLRPSCARATWSSSWHWFRNPRGQNLQTKGLSSSGVWNLKKDKKTNLK